VLTLFCIPVPAGDAAVAVVSRFPQEVALRYAEEQGVPGMDVRQVIILPDGRPAVATNQGAALFENGAWRHVGPARASLLVSTRDGLLSADGLDLMKLDGGQAAELPGTPTALLDAGGRLLAGTEAGLYVGVPGDTGEVRFGPSTLNGLLGARTRIHALVQQPGAPLAVAAAEAGLFRETDSDVWEPFEAVDENGLPWHLAPVAGMAFDSHGSLWMATRAGVARHDAEDGWTFYRGGDGLPFNDFTCVAAAPNGDVWFGTAIGAVRWRDGEGFAYRQGPRWLPDDHVRGIGVGRDGTVWFATAKGIGCIEYRMMTLAEKAAYYEEEVEKYIKRTEWGYTSEVHFAKPGDRNSEIRRTDSDNDGLWTAMYGAGECFAFAATGDPKSRERARQAFEALRFLQKVTQGAEHSPPHGYVARTILPADGPDPNEGRVEGDLQHREVRDSLWKIYEPRWPLSADGKWYFKTDTSSDELDGHYFFYPLYYDLVADTDEEKERVREVVRDLTDHLLEHGFYLVDHDDTPTRWSVYAPEAMNHDKMWWSERGLKSLSMLSYLAVAHHMTGDEKYADAFRELDERFAYVQNAMLTKVQFGVGSGNQSDDEMAIMCYYNFMKYAPDEAMRDRIRYSFYSYWTLMEPEMNPFFHFAYAACGLGETWTNPWGTFDISPWDGWLEDSVATLKGFPLDRFSWPHRNSHRLDIVRLRRQQAVEPYEEPETGRGHTVNGKVLPVENRHFNHWNTDPWRLDYGGDGRTLGSGTVFLLPYYMGLYHGFIREDQ
jgi:hypothetical protein